MHTDISRDSHDPKKNFTRVLMQQGRLIVDADWNEQSAIVLNYLRTLAADIIGWHGGPGVSPGNGNHYKKNSSDTSGNPEGTGPFLVTLAANDDVEKVLGGRYYIDGIQIEMEETPFKHDQEPHIIIDNENDQGNSLPNRLLFLDTWERHVVAEIESSIRDDAFGGIDTTTRVQLVTRVRMLYTEINETTEELKRPSRESEKLPGFRNILIKKIATDDGTKAPPIDRRRLHETSLPKLIAWTNLNSSVQEDCAEEVVSGYTGLENQLYRVEVHHAGKDGRTFWDPEAKDQNDAFSLKWSRDNGSIVYAATAGTTTARLKTKWRDESRAIRQGDLVELIPSSRDSGTIVSVTSVQDDNGVITIGFAQPKEAAFKPEDSVIIRRWDHRNRKSFPICANGGFLVKEQIDKDKHKTGDSVAIPIEDGVIVRLSLGKDGLILQEGDYWLIPARAATGDVIWPRDESDSSKPMAVPARYTEHHYAPIALIKAGGTIVDLRWKITPVTGE